MDGPTDDRATSFQAVVEHAVAVSLTVLVLENHSRLPEVQGVVFLPLLVAVPALALSYSYRLAQYLNRPTRTARDTHTSSVHVQHGQGVAEISERSHKLPRVTVTKRFVLNWLVLPVCLIMMMISAATHWTAMIRFYFSRASFEELVAQAESGQMPHGFPRRVGLYWIEKVKLIDRNEKTGRDRIGFVTGVVLIDSCGLEYDDANLPPSHYLRTRIAPCWYLTEW